MSRRFLSANLVIAIAALFSLVVSLSGSNSAHYESAGLLLDSESLLSLKKGIVFNSATQADLELIPGVSKKLADDFLDRRGTVLAQAAKLPDEHRYEALELIKGVGKKNAKKFDQYFDLAF